MATKTLCAYGAAAWTIEILFFLIIAIIVLWLFYKFLQGPNYTKRNQIIGKVAIITGCNTGIGKETALELAYRGGRIYMACRDAKRCEAARQEIIKKTGNPNVFNRTLDVASLKSVREFVAGFLAEEDRLDILVNNAGVMQIPTRKLTADGFEMQIGTNHLGHFLLTNLLLDRLKSTAPSRIVVVSSIAYAIGRIQKDNLLSEKNYNDTRAYCSSKLANILFTRKLAEKLQGTQVLVNCLHPGVVRTELTRYHESWYHKLMWLLMAPFLKSARAGAQTSLKLALDPDLKTSGNYYSDSIRMPLLPRARNKAMADWLWTESERLVGISSKNGISTVHSN